MEERARLGVVFVHGFKSQPAIWNAFQSLIADDADLNFVQPLPFSYATRLWQPHPLRRLPTFDTIADSLKEFLDTEAEDFGHLMLVGHSQGGLIVQRCLARMLAEGRGQDLARIRHVVLFACPNNGSQLALTLRRGLLGAHPQERQLRPLDEQITDTQRTILWDVVLAREVTERSCPIAFSVYAAESDNIVTPPSARSVFPKAAVLPGDHFSIVQPRSREHRSYTTLKRLILAVDKDPPVHRATLSALGPAGLEVHNAAAPGAPPSTHASLTPYLPRAHDALLRAALASVLAGGPSRLMVLTGESSTGKTRALYEALYELGPTRPLLTPTTSTDLLGLVQKGAVAAGTVLWLNEAHRFLYGPRGEEVAARLQDLLRNRAGVAVLATLWTDPYWNELTRDDRSDTQHSHARALLTHPALAIRILIPTQLGGAECDRWLTLTRAHHDQRLSDAWNAGRSDSRVIQHLSGGPELLAAYLAGPGTHFTYEEHALLTAALDARRLGYLAPLPPALLADSADGALGPRHRSPDGHWADHALDALATGKRPDGTRTDVRNTLTALTALRPRSGSPAQYEPADYLIAHALVPGVDRIGAPSLWQALVDHATDAGDLCRIAGTAWQYGLYRQAVLLWQKAVLAHHPGAAAQLVTRLTATLDPHRRGADWIAAHADLTDPGG
ncbi:esterase/lipase family protein, partial [Streptomyces mirabilis]|uniref:esterase/lipase family protein n=1 Tax=Streptomyces mirabilis TaxID=68239 RepID=UPI0035E0C628